jgi:Icc protein
MIVAQLTDTHIKPERRTAYGFVDTAGMLERAVAHINTFKPNIDAVFVTGDLTDRGKPEEFEALRSILDEISVPWYVVPGNHDERGNFLRAFADHHYLADSHDFIHYAIEDFPLRLVGLDTTVPGKPHGCLTQERLSWLDDCLRSARQKPTMLFLHHPPFETGIRHMDVQNLLNGEDLFAVLAEHPQVKHVACGHVHRASETCINGIAVSIAPNAAHSTTLDLDPNGPSSFTMDPPAVRLFRFGKDGHVVTHLSYIGDFDGPHPYFTADGALVD